MPLPIRLLGSGGQTHDVVVNNTVNGESFIVSVPFEVTGAQFDPDKHIVSKNNTVTLGNESFEINDTISLYPVPTSNELHIQLPTNIDVIEVKIVNALGQLEGNYFSKDLDVSALPVGLHWVEIQTAEGVFHKSFIKK